MICRLKPYLSCLSLVCLLAGLTAGLSACADRDAYLAVGDREERRVMGELLRLLEEQKGKARFTLIRQISDLLRKNGYVERQILFLTRYAEKHPKDPYNTFYLALVAEAYEEMGAIPFAVHYYERILKNHPDILVRGGSVHFLCLRKLLQHVENREYRIEYYKELISRFGSHIDIGTYYYYLARTYEDVGAWGLSMQAYKQFLRNAATRIPGRPDAQREVEEKVAFYYSKKSWTEPDLQFLVSQIKKALRTKNAAKLKRYQAQINFFTKYWGQKDFDQSMLAYFDIDNWLLKSKVRYAEELDKDSNSREAYLKTWNWLYRVGTWYFYFRRVDYPADPEIDGRWEWAGVYFGEKG